MARLTAQDRRGIPKSQFGLPERRAYPVHDRLHAGLAKAYATRNYRRGNLSKEQMQAIFGKANRTLGRK